MQFDCTAQNLWPAAIWALSFGEKQWLGLILMRPVGLICGSKTKSAGNRQTSIIGAKIIWHRGATDLTSLWCTCPCFTRSRNYYSSRTCGLPHDYHINVVCGAYARTGRRGGWSRTGPAVSVTCCADRNAQPACQRMFKCRSPSFPANGHVEAATTNSWTRVDLRATSSGVTCN